MIDKLALQLTSFICTDAYDNAKDRARIQYGLSIFLSEGFKIVSLILLFNFIHNEKYFYFSLLILMSIRIFAGGVHVTGALNCLLLTILLFMCTCVLAPLMPRLPTICYLLIGIFSLVIALVRAPICSVRRPIKDSKIKLQYKLTAALFVTLWTIILFFLESTPYINCGFSTIFMQNIQLVLAKKKI
ncbi:accessory gene regulator B family protein [Candidatus Clostridium radicumherbarum]|uniref:Accessory gene regulator B family protein n=1 Tax=Candidatus Clostridium radicumherbarum TaxID=3381662 RepID=A0ABW8TQP2_9CLOT